MRTELLDTHAALTLLWLQFALVAVPIRLDAQRPRLRDERLRKCVAEVFSPDRMRDAIAAFDEHRSAPGALCAVVST